jgi:hypothetical protein
MTEIVTKNRKFLFSRLDGAKLRRTRPEGASDVSEADLNRFAGLDIQVTKGAFKRNKIFFSQRDKKTNHKETLMNRCSTIPNQIGSHSDE